MIGTWRRANPGAPEDTTIATKATFRMKDGKRFISKDLAFIEGLPDRSLRLLGVDYVDLCYAHRLQPGRAPENVAGEMGRLIEKGKTRAIGFSEIAPSTLRRAHSGRPVAAVESEYSLQTRATDLGLVQTCAELGVSLVAFCPVGRGF